MVFQLPSNLCLHLTLKAMLLCCQLARLKELWKTISINKDTGIVTKVFDFLYSVMFTGQIRSSFWVILTSLTWLVIIKVIHSNLLS